MSYGKKCNLIFIRKVGNRLHELEEKYKDWTPKKRAAEINKELLINFCVEERQIRPFYGTASKNQMTL
jgi:FKBP-type peptidyl-prolyl cis-trans isomerase (trigger factor)